MQKQLKVWQLISRSLQQKVPVMLLYVLESFGSSPGREGFCMAINLKGEMQGSIGGGIMEHKFAEMAKEELRTETRSCKIYKQVHNKAALQFQSGMICSGEQSNLVYRPTAADCNSVKKIIDCISNNQTGTLRLSGKGIEFSDEVPEEHFRYHVQDEGDWLYEETIGFKNKLHIIGAGHCALALSRIMSSMDFYMHLYENRETLSTFVKNKYVNRKSVIDDYNNLKEVIPSGNNIYVVVMTVGYRTDDIVVRALLEKKFRFFGVLGSTKKIEKMFDTYRAEGISEKVLNEIHAPVGLPINSQTPEEIAISIAAQIIRVKNSVTKK